MVWIYSKMKEAPGDRQIVPYDCLILQTVYNAHEWEDAMTSGVLENYHQELIERITVYNRGEKAKKTPVDALNLFQWSDSSEMVATLYEPSLCIIVQGAKTVGFGDRLFHYDPYSYMLSSVHMPAKVRISQASRKKPYMGMSVNFSMEQIYEILEELSPLPREPGAHDPKQGLYFGAMEVTLIDPVTRLVRLLDRPEDIPVMAPLILKEILYIVMRGDGGEFIRRYAMSRRLQRSKKISKRGLV